MVRWVKPEEPPQEGTYILVKESDPDEGIVCSQGAYENGKFWYAPDADVEIPSSRIIGWSYLPYDTRLDSLGNVKLC